MSPGATPLIHEHDRLGSSPPRAKRRGPPRSDNIRRENRNVFAVMTLFAGICSWVPLVIVVAFPLALASALLSLVTVWRHRSRRGFSATIFGLILAVTAVCVHLAVAGLGGIIGWIGHWLGF